MEPTVLTVEEAYQLGSIRTARNNAYAQYVAHLDESMRQWLERLEKRLDLPPGSLIGSETKRPTHRLTDNFTVEEIEQDAAPSLERVK